MTSHPPSGDPVPAITEAEATGETAAIYTDIRATTGVPVVNLIWRHLATMDGALPWTWGMLRPLYAADTVASAAAALREGLALPAMQPWPVSVLECAGLSPDDRTAISRILRSYDRSNAMNLVALAALQAQLRGETDTAPLPETAPGADIQGQLPTLLTFGQMSPATADLVYRLNAIGDPEHKVIASMYRHLAHWPGFLALVWERLIPLTDGGQIDAIIATNLEKGRNIARRLAAQIPAPAQAPSAETMEQANAALDLFIRYAIGRMVPLGSLVARSFPHSE
jgi:hypothetical protein